MLENIWLLGYHWCVSLDSESRSQPRWGSWWEPQKYLGRVALQITYQQSPAAAVGTHVLFEQTTSPMVSDLCCRVQKKHKKIDTWCLTWIRMVCFWANSCLTDILSRWVGDEDCLQHRFARLSWLKVDCDTQSLCDDAFETWSWHPTKELLWSHCDTVKLNTMSGSDMGPGVLQTKKKHVHVVRFETMQN